MTAPTSLPDDVLDLLAAYALDALEPEEIARVSELLAERPELRALVAELRATADRLPEALPDSEPPAALRRQVLEAATGRARADRPRARPWRRWVLSLGGLAAAALVAAALGFAQLAGAQAELARVRAELAAERAARDEVVAAVAGGTPIAALDGEAGSGAVLAAPDGTTLVVARLPQLSAGRAYQLWLVGGDGAPQSGGTFGVDAQGYGTLRLPAGTQPADTYAVTDEPAGGSPGPTTPILIAGARAET